MASPFSDFEGANPAKGQSFSKSDRKRRSRGVFDLRPTARAITILAVAGIAAHILFRYFLGT